MERRRRLGSLVFAICLTLVAGWWLLTRNPPPTATVGYFGENKFLCVRAGQLITLRFSKPLPSGSKEYREELQKKGLGDYAEGTNPEIVAESQYWGGIGSSEWWYVSETEIMYRVPTGIYGIYPIVFPFPKQIPSGGNFEVMLFILGDKDLDVMIQRQEPLPLDGKVPSKGTVEVYYSEPSPWKRLWFWLHQKFWEYGF